MHLWSKFKPFGNVQLLTSPFLIWVCLWGNPKSPLFWTSIVEKVARRLDSWKDSYISKGGRLTLLQFVFNNISIYCFSIFIAPSSFCKTVEKLRRNFLWEGSDKHGGAHLVRWDIVTLPTEQRGLGIDKINFLNTALLCKWLCATTLKKIAYGEPSSTSNINQPNLVSSPLSASTLVLEPPSYTYQNSKILCLIISLGEFKTMRRLCFGFIVGRQMEFYKPL